MIYNRTFEKVSRKTSRPWKGLGGLRAKDPIAGLRERVASLPVADEQISGHEEQDSPTPSPAMVFLLPSSYRATGDAMSKTITRRFFWLAPCSLTDGRIRKLKSTSTAANTSGYLPSTMLRTHVPRSPPAEYQALMNARTTETRAIDLQPPAERGRRALPGVGWLSVEIDHDRQGHRREACQEDVRALSHLEVDELRHDRGEPRPEPKVEGVDEVQYEGGGVEEESDVTVLRLHLFAQGFLRRAQDRVKTLLLREARGDAGPSYPSFLPKTR